ncbi:MAG: MFS transporter [Succinivibrio sp.]
MTKAKKSTLNRHSVYFYIVTVALMASVFGFNLGAVLSSKVRLINIFMLEIYDIDSMVNTYLIGSIVGIFLGGRIVYDTGCVQSLIGSFCLGVIGQCTSILSPTFSSLFIAEFAVGVAFGVYLVASICYIVELSPSDKRGQCSTLIWVFLISGFLTSLMLKDFLPRNGISAVIVILSVSVPIMVVSYLRLPESPRWLALSDYSDKALSELIRLRSSTSEAARELAAINECVLGEDRGIQLFFRNSVFRTVLWFMLLLLTLLHISGLAIMPYMSLEIIKTFKASLGVLLPNERTEINYMMLKTVVFTILLAAVLTFFMIDRVGHKALLIVSVSINFIGLLILYFIYFIPSQTFGPVLIASAFILLSFGSSLAFITFLGVIVPELLPAKGRVFGITTILLFNSVAIMLGIFFFSSFVHSQGMLLLLSIFIMATAWLFTLIYQGLPETKHHMLESMENTIFNERSLRAIDRENSDN